MSKSEGMPADWYADPAEVGELRYYDGTQWTEHVTIDGVQTTSPYEPEEPPDEADPISASSFTLSRAAQWRTEEEKALEVTGPTSSLGQFVTTLDGAPGYRFEDAQGGTVLTLTKPGLKNEVDVDDPAGYRVGSISKIGRLHSRYDISRVDTDDIVTVKLLPGATDEWHLQLGGGRGATITRKTASPADALNLADVTYAVTITAPIDDQLHHLLLAVPMAIDILDTQAL